MLLVTFKMHIEYGEDYYLRGVTTGLSNYENYRWMEERTMRFASRLCEVMRIRPAQRFLDFGCARGYTVKAMRRLQIEAWGYDTSDWAISNCDEEAKPWLTKVLEDTAHDHVLMKDVCEHMTLSEIILTMERLLRRTEKSILIMVPLTHSVGGQYVRREDDMDVTHRVRWPLQDWMAFIQARIPGESWTLSGSWHIQGLKPSSLSHPKSCGFILLRRS